MTKRAAWFVYPVMVIAMVNFVAFVTIAIWIGGDAINGRISNGHYYVMEHGRYTEVTKAVWDYSRCHAISVWITHGLFFLTYFIFLWAGEIKTQQKSASIADAGRDLPN
jgi:hypothetical protein